MAAPPQPKPRKFPPPCWTNDEAQGLISIYKDTWSALGRSNLRASDWETVAAALASRCPLVSPPKTAIQCRHKMEKLRKRYRNEKQRGLTHPGRFLSTWDLFRPMFDLECEAPALFGSDPDRETRVGVQFGRGFRVRKDENDRYLAESDQNLSDPDEETWKGAGFRGGFRVNVGVRGKGGENSSFSAGFDRYVSRGNDEARGFPVKSSGDRNLGPSEFGSKSYGKTCNEKFSPKRNLKRDCSYGAGTKSGFYKKFRGGLDSDGVGKEVEDPIGQMASSVEFMGEVFLKMETKKMEMARDIVKMRMEMEMRQNELIMESQKQVLAACVDALLESKKKKKMKVVSSDS
ncbi:PREDICTED: trihelix [Prunus dulcis]|uniref:PREDICTED: trihelix n=1 Tax=Prunus dulcis TaxID=3755 RepID=A0A5E4FHV5_PRUDU|nr:protein FIP2-like [Prunus dulcis]VVA26251.1 PREDICTED: trihelix [Prunus dulcis]